MSNLQSTASSAKQSLEKMPLQNIEDNSNLAVFQKSKVEPKNQTTDVSGSEIVQERGCPEVDAVIHDFSDDNDITAIREQTTEGSRSNVSLSSSPSMEPEPKRLRRRLSKETDDEDPADESDGETGENSDEKVEDLDIELDETDLSLNIPTKVIKFLKSHHIKGKMPTKEEQYILAEKSGASVYMVWMWFAKKIELESEQNVRFLDDRVKENRPASAAELNEWIGKTGLSSEEIKKVFDKKWHNWQREEEEEANGPLRASDFMDSLSVGFPLPHSQSLEFDKWTRRETAQFLSNIVSIRTVFILHARNIRGRNLHSFVDRDSREILFRNVNYKQNGGEKSLDWRDFTRIANAVEKLEEDAEDKCFSNWSTRVTSYFPIIPANSQLQIPRREKQNYEAWRAEEVQEWTEKFLSEPASNLLFDLGIKGTDLDSFNNKEHYERILEGVANGKEILSWENYCLIYIEVRGMRED